MVLPYVWLSASSWDKCLCTAWMRQRCRNESCHTYEQVIPHMTMLCHTHGWACHTHFGRIMRQMPMTAWMRQRCQNESCHTVMSRIVMSHVWISPVTHGQIMSDIWMSHVTHILSGSWDKCPSTAWMTKRCRPCLPYSNSPLAAPGRTTSWSFRTRFGLWSHCWSKRSHCLLILRAWNQVEQRYDSHPFQHSRLMQIALVLYRIWVMVPLLIGMVPLLL